MLAQTVGLLPATAAMLTVAAGAKAIAVLLLTFLMHPSWLAVATTVNSKPEEGHPLVGLLQVTASRCPISPAASTEPETTYKHDNLLVFTAETAYGHVALVWTPNQPAACKRPTYRCFPGHDHE